KPLTSLNGTAQDSGPAGIARMEIQIQDGLNYWDGTGFNTAASTWVPAAGSGSGSISWSYPGGVVGQNLPAWQSGKQYLVRARATDNATNTSAFVENSFVYDTQIPTTTLQMPNLAFEKSLPIISGTADESVQPNYAGLQKV